MRKFISTFSLPTRVGTGLMGFVLTLVIILLVSCGKDILPEPVVTSPVISTTEVTSVTTTSVISGGNISSDGGAKVTDRGVCWGLTNNPSINDNKSANGSGVGTFSITLSGLIPGTSYNLRSYAVTSLGTFYGNNVSFITNPTMYSVSLTSGPNGTVASLPKETAKGSSLEVKTTPSVGFMTDSIRIDEKSFALNGTNSYTIANVSKNTTIYVTFKPDPKWILSQHPWYTVMEQRRYVNTIPWTNFYPSTGILVEKYEFYQSSGVFKIKTTWPKDGSGPYEHVCTMKGDSLIWGTKLDGTMGKRMKIISVDSKNLVLGSVVKYIDFDGNRVPSKDIDVQYYYESEQSSK